jgi:hypothetical protein
MQSNMILTKLLVYGGDGNSRWKEFAMPEVPEDSEREPRITMEIIVDAFGPEEQAMGWYYYLENTITFPFKGICIAERAISSLQVGDRVEILGMAPEEECRHEMFVEIRRGKRELAVPLAQVEPTEAADEETQEAVADWQYWVARRYEF